MKSLSIGVFGLVLLSCSLVEQESSSESVDLTVVNPELPPQPKIDPVEWSCSQDEEYSSLGNKWWAGFSACEGDTRIDLEADSVNLRGPDLQFSVYTKDCPAGHPEESGHVDHAVFLEPFDRQLVIIKQQITTSLSRLKSLCGAPTDGAALLGPKFDRAFHALADSTWLGLSKAQMQESWASNR